MPNEYFDHDQGQHIQWNLIFPLSSVGNSLPCAIHVMCFFFVLSPNDYHPMALITQRARGLRTESVQFNIDEITQIYHCTIFCDEVHALGTGFSHMLQLKLDTFNQHLSLALSNVHWCDSKPTSLLYTIEKTTRSNLVDKDMSHCSSSLEPYERWHATIYKFQHGNPTWCPCKQAKVALDSLSYHYQ